VTAAFMLNPRIIFWQRSLGVARGIRRGLMRPSSWRKVIRGDVPFARVVALAGQLPAALVGFPRRSLAQRRTRRVAETELDGALDRLREAGKHILLAFSENEPVHEELERDGQWDRRDRWPNVEFALIPGRDHALRPVESQRCAHDHLDLALDQELQRLLDAPERVVTG
jgi:hypothetical protein